MLLAFVLVVGLAAPASAHEMPSGAEVGRIVIPAIGLDEVVREGIEQWVIDLGVAHWPGTARPGEDGNVVLAGHRTVATRPFYDLGRLRPGDRVHLEWRDGSRHTYRVTETFVVPPTGVWIVDPTPVPTVTMFSCHPKGSARQRIVVRAELVPAAATPVPERARLAGVLIT